MLGEVVGLAVRGVGWCGAHCSTAEWEIGGGGRMARRDCGGGAVMAWCWRYTCGSTAGYGVSGDEGVGWCWRGTGTSTAGGVVDTDGWIVRCWRRTGGSTVRCWGDAFALTA